MRLCSLLLGFSYVNPFNMSGNGIILDEGGREGDWERDRDGKKST